MDNKLKWNCTLFKPLLYDGDDGSKQVLFFYTGTDSCGYIVMVGKENVLEIQKFQEGFDGLKVVDAFKVSKANKWGLTF